jgi:hypothetical protein
MKPYKAMAHIHSLNGELREVTVLEQKDSVNYIVEYGGVKCTAVFNFYVCQFYADDKYGVIKEN